MLMRAPVGQLLMMFIGLIFSTECLCQTKIDAHNIDYLFFYLPLYKDSKIKEIKKTQIDSSGKIVTIERSMFDRNGYLNSLINIDHSNFFGDSEIIVIESNDYNSFCVTRTISQPALLKATEVPHSFWGLYDSISKITTLKDSPFIRVKSIYKWRKDSSFSYETSVNGVNLATGNIETLISPDSQQFPLYKKIDTTFSNDTTIIKTIVNPFGSRFEKDIKFLYKNKLVKTTYEITDGRFEEFGTTLYAYNNSGQKTMETYYNNVGNKFRGKKEFLYSSNRDISPDVEKNYDYNNEITSIVTYDKNVRIVENFEKRVFASDHFKMVMQKVTEEFKENNLMRQQIFLDDQLMWTTLYEYDFY